MEIQILKKQGKSLREIAQELGVSVNTVRKYADGEISPSYGPRTRRPGKLGPYEHYLRERVEAARPYWIPATVLHREIQERGFQGCERLVRNFVRTLRPVRRDDPVVRFETEPGQQMQVDWIEFKRDGLIAFVATLGHSRAAYVEYVPDMRVETLMSCHVRTFDYFGGVVREVLYDNVKTVVIDRDAYGPGEHRFQDAMWDLAKHYNFRLRLCRPYRAKTKGKVERFNGFLRHSFHVPLLTRLRQEGLRLDQKTADIEVRRWLREVANARVHADTGWVPAEALIKEQAAMQSLPAPYRGDVRTARGRTSVDQKSMRLPDKALIAVPGQHALSSYDQLLGVAV